MAFTFKGHANGLKHHNHTAGPTRDSIEKQEFSALGRTATMLVHIGEMGGIGGEHPVWYR